MPILREDKCLGEITVTTVRIDHPPLNILDLDHCEELLSTLSEIHGDGRARILILRGEGQHFSAGVDIRQHDAETMPSLLPAFHNVIRELLRLSTINIAAVSGACLGGGAEIALACDLVFIEQGARFGFPEIQIGCYPPVAIPMLTHRAGYHRAFRAILSGEDIPLRELEAWGVIAGITSPGGMDPILEQEFARYADKSPTVLGIAARLLHDEARRAWGDRIDHVEEEYLQKLLPQADMVEGINAFLEKRKPAWRSLDENIDIGSIEGMAQ